MEQPACPHLSPVLSQIPSGLYVLTSAHDDTRSGVLVQWVQQCADNPPMIVVALRKGHPIEPLIRDSRCFALCQLDPEESLLRKKFASIPDHGEDPFISIPTATAPLGSPILERAQSWLECEMLRHLDIECDYEVYIGNVRSGDMLVDPPGGAGPKRNGTGRGSNGRASTNGTEAGPAKRRRRRSA